MKKCVNCQKEKDEAEFYKKKASPDGLQRMCKECDRKRLDEFYQKNLEENRLKRKIWQDLNRELHNEHVRRYNDRKKKEVYRSIS